jgi:hypothetical protein
LFYGEVHLARERDETKSEKPKRQGEKDGRTGLVSEPEVRASETRYHEKAGRNATRNRPVDRTVDEARS